MTGSLKDLMKTQRHFFNLILMSAIWMLTSTVYYLTDFQLRYFGGNVFSNAMASALVGIPSTLCSGFMVQKVGVKVSFIVFSTTTIVGSVLIITLFDYKSLMPYLYSQEDLDLVV